MLEEAFSKQKDKDNDQQKVQNQANQPDKPQLIENI